MKKLLVLSLFCLCVSPVFAQKNFWRGVTHWKKPAAFETNIKAAVLRTEAALKLPGSPHIRITNLPGEPTVKLGGAVDNAPAVLSARLLDGEALYAGIFPQTRQMIVPSALTRREKAAVYRGMYMADLKNVGNLLINGLEINKSDAYPGEIYTTPFLRMALGYAVPKPGVKPKIPVLVRIRLTTELLDKKASVSWGAERVFYKAIPASFLSDVMVFLEVNGKPDWYKVSLENDELIFTPAPSRVFKVTELLRRRP